MPGTEVKKEFIVFGRPDISSAEYRAVLDVLESGWLSTGKVCDMFAKEFEYRIGYGYAVPVSSCTMGLYLSLKYFNIGPGDEVLLPTITFCSTANAIIATGAKPVFCEVTDSGHIDPFKLKITERTKAIIPVHYTGSACDMNSILSIAKDTDLKVIEDSAHAFGGKYLDSNQNIGVKGDFSCFSFYATKNVTCGEGGMVLTDDPEQAEQIRILSMNGLSSDSWNRYGSGKIKQYSIMVPGMKGNLSDIHAAIGLTQLRRWPEMKKTRDMIWEVYENYFGKKAYGHSTHLFTIEHEDRDGLREFLYENGIGSGIHFRPLHLEPAYVHFGFKEGSFPVAEGIGRRTLSLPVSSTMTREDAEFIAQKVKDYGEGKNV